MEKNPYWKFILKCLPNFYWVKDSLNRGILPSCSSRMSSQGYIFLLQ